MAAPGGGPDLTTIDAILKDVFLPPVQRQLNDENLLLPRIEARSQEIAFGRQAIVPLSVGRSGGVGARGEWEQLPAPGNQVFNKAVYDIKYLYGVFGVSGPSEFKTRSETGAFLKALQAEIDGLRMDLQRDLTRMVYGTGDGVIATCGTTTAASVVVLASREPIDKGQLYVGRVVDIGTLAAPTTVAAARTITAVNPATPSITISGAVVTTSASHFVFNQGNNVANVTREISGLKQIVPSAAANTFGGIDASTNTYWDNIRVNMGGALDRDKMLQALNQVTIAGGNPNNVMMITTFGVQRAYFNSFSTNVRYNDPKRLSGGFTALDFNGIDLVADRDAPWGTMYVLDLNALKVYSTGDWDFLNRDGHTLKWIDNYDAWKGVLARYMNLGATRRNTLAVIFGITDATGY